MHTRTSARACAGTPTHCAVDVHSNCVHAPCGVHMAAQAQQSQNYEVTHMCMDLPDGHVEDLGKDMGEGREGGRGEEGGREGGREGRKEKEEGRRGERGEGGGDTTVPELHFKQ